ncbi:PLDc N-terminal domain-containing protein [Sporosalibacterium faouarense]|uniref:PLDc N-terminal domain-containing protein n=1 Tax=Sporosalibacterium faouarense TaxID=516123 RepID=UPI00141CCC79|nr:PLDc N-terminal domain-containing protein [Sporosalibacterium faouarense]MTI47500.1 hypothetical protein [Bacillota bacterium]
MFEGLTTLQIIKLLLPLLVLEFGLKILCITLILKNGVRNLSKIAWIIIVLMISTFGSIAFLLVGRRRY